MNPSNYYSGYIILDILLSVIIALATLVNLGILAVIIKLYTEFFKVMTLVKNRGI